MVGTPLVRLADPEPGRGGILSLRRIAVGSSKYGLGNEDFDVPQRFRFQEMKPAGQDPTGNCLSSFDTQFLRLLEPIVPPKPFLFVPDSSPRSIYG